MKAETLLRSAAQKLRGQRRDVINNLIQVLVGMRDPELTGRGRLLRRNGPQPSMLEMVLRDVDRAFQ